MKFKYTFENYDLPLYLAGHPEDFFKESDYIIPPPSLSKNSNLYKKVICNRSEVLEVDDILNMIKPDKPVLCITGTNGKTTTTTSIEAYMQLLRDNYHGAWFQRITGEY